MQQANIQATSGTIEYTMQNIIEPYFADFNGIASVSTTQRFGDFDFGRITAPVSPWIRDRLQERIGLELSNKSVKAAISIRSKNQYRLYFNDGYILTTTFFDNRPPEFTFQHYETTNFASTYVPTFLSSTVLADGRERAVMGTSDGSMWVVDGAQGVQTGSGLTAMDAFITVNPVNLNRPESTAKYHHVVLQGQFYGWQAIDGWADSNYVFDATGAAHDSINIGAATLTSVVDSKNEVDSIYLPMLADGYSVKLQTSVDGSKPHTLQSLLYRATTKGTDRNRTNKAY
jgi:hypothetical protein